MEPDTRLSRHQVRLDVVTQAQIDLMLRRRLDLPGTLIDVLLRAVRRPVIASASCNSSVVMGTFPGTCKAGATCSSSRIGFIPTLNRCFLYPIF